MRGHARLLCTSAAASFLALKSTDYIAPSSCDAAALPQRVVYINPEPSLAVSIQELLRWLESRGCNVSGIDIKSNSSSASLDPDARFGVFANAETRRRTSRSILGSLLYEKEACVATFPITTNAITSSTVVELPIQGPEIAHLLQNDVIDDRIAVSIHLVVEKTRGSQSPLRPWLSLLPETFSTTLFWSEDELNWLRGTPLHAATMLKKQSLSTLWRTVEPTCRRLALKESAHDIPTFSDFLWAYSIFWSRALSFPSVDPSQKNAITMQEGIVPGLDFTNHSVDAAQCRWTVSSSNGRLYKGIPPTELRLLCSQKSTRRGIGPGTELFINYGEKSNEELLFLYGFAQESNPHDALMIALPLANPSEWDSVLHARMELLRRRGLVPQIFLPAQHLSSSLNGCDARAKKRDSVLKGGTTPEMGRRGILSDSDDIYADAVREGDMPEGVLETLKVFVMDASKVQKCLSHTEENGAKNKNDIKEEPGSMLGVLTTLVSLLELKIEELESNEMGTGPLERDEALLQAASIDKSTNSNNISNNNNNNAGKRPQRVLLSSREKNALIYRMGQKKLARRYLVYCNALLQREMRYLKTTA